jgi:acetolactate synthase-1/2/3 large subunit
MLVVLRAAIPAASISSIAARGDVIRRARVNTLARSREAATAGWNASPISSARLCAEIWHAIRTENWSLLSRSPSDWANRLWTFDQYHQSIGASGGSGIGYGLPAAVGAALGFRDKGIFCVNIQNDGDCMYAPGALWTSVHHGIPLLHVMNNNRAYHQEVMHLQRMSAWRDRGITAGPVGTTIQDPNIDFAKLAQSMGVQGIGQIENPSDLAPALKRAVQIVKAGEPALVDVITQPR